MKRIVLFDGACNFCNANVHFIINRDPYAHFYFSSLQSDKGQELVQKFAIPKEKDSLVLIENNKVYTESSAALHIAKKLDGLWHLLFLLILIPRPIRDGVYKCIAKNRYNWFAKKKDSCTLPSSEIRRRFL
ncbi:thiol-disulfide oxidoreductase DCC family protein [Sporosarcina pasteurii]|uniref:Protein of uncharacterized function, DUF393 n=1 Tax=Sporosarcina pasteurii TaxID=1474 RepID=A0A380CL28_SPOPA|nr:DCC1-like thiol-disulfide oxidoreductase family protein [Sporosarcina pasteurii]MDS9471964.1 DCC1-like thiol-disulfide oxidoreductase family protein [Sporosarcina pasteurii]QBQ06695.1 DUF393 domain-containing protein [Sporosarcina pasteurii]SUJ21655.1 Protein of uncharacterised function, DUF393 [Sporosarcina pasteurii]